MKYTAIICALYGANAIGRHHHHRPHGGADLIQIRTNANADMLADVNAKIDDVATLLEKKKEPACDEKCKAGCDEVADNMIRELHNPLHDITWNCKNNYDTYTTDYDPEHNHFDRISMDVMATQRTLNRIQ